MSGGQASRSEATVLNSRRSDILSRFFSPPSEQSEFFSTHKNRMTFPRLQAKAWSGPNAAGHVELPAVAPSGDFKGASDRQKEMPPPSSVWT